MPSKSHQSICMGSSWLAEKLFSRVFVKNVASKFYIRKYPDLKYRFGHAPAVKCMKKLRTGKNYEACASSLCYALFLDGQYDPECEQAQESDKSALHQHHYGPPECNDRLAGLARRPLHHLGVQGVDAEGKGRQTVGNEVYP